MNVNFKVYWNNPIEMSTEAGTQQLMFEVPLGAIISNPSEVIPDYPSFTGNADKVLTVNATEDDVEWTTPLTQVYVDTQDSLLQDQIDLKADAIAMNQVLSTKADLINGLIPASQLPSYVDDVLSFPDLMSFPSVGEDGKIYIAEDVNKTYRWGGISYVEIGGGGVALGETSSTAYRGDRGKIAYDHALSQGNPHNISTSEILLDVLSLLDSSSVNVGDNLAVIAGKLQAQINNSGGGSSPTWVNVSNFSTVLGVLNMAQTKLEMAKIDGMLWLRGYYTTSGNAASSGSSIFRVNDPTWFVKLPDHAIKNPIMSANLCAAGVGTNQHRVQVVTGYPYTGMDFINGVSVAANTFVGVTPTCIGEAV